MVPFEFEPRTLLVNSPSDFPLYFYTLVNNRLNLIETGDVFDTALNTQTTEAAGFAPVTSVVAPLDIDSLTITGFKSYVRGQIDRVVKSRGIGEQAEVSTMTISVNTPDVGSQVRVQIVFRSWDEKAEFVSHSSDFAITRSYLIDIAVGETAATLAAKIAANMSNAGNKEERYFPLIVTVAANVVTFRSRDGFTDFDVSLTGATETLVAAAAINQVAAGKVTGVVATTTPSFSGRGNFANMRMIRPETPANTYNYAVGPETMQKPIKGALYTMFYIFETIPVPQVVITSRTRVIQSVLYINETLGQAYINSLVAYFNSAATVKENYAATTPAAALALEVPAATLSVN